jgi:ubiquinone/menaquinone biosynthesis C-methylase UbiE
MDFLPVENVFPFLQVHDRFQVAEFGSGSGSLTVELAKRFSRGMVHAIDIQQEKLSVLRQKTGVASMANVTTLLGDLEEPEGSGLNRDSMHLVFIPNLLFQAANRYAILKEAQRVLKPRGQLVVIDWIKKLLPGQHTLTDRNEIKTAAQTLGMKLRHELGLGNYHYALVFYKQP